MADDALTGVVFQTLSTGTGAIVAEAASAPNGYRMPPETLNGLLVSYEIETADAAERENGRGIWTDSTSTLSRDQVVYSTNANAAVSFSAGTKQVSLVALPGDLVALDHTHPPPDAEAIETAYHSQVLAVDEIEARAGTSMVTRQWSAQASRWTSEDAIAELTDGRFTAIDDPTDYSVATGTPFQVSAANGHDGTALEVRRRNQLRRLTAANPSVVFTAVNLEVADYGEIWNETGTSFTPSAGANTTLYDNGPVPDGESFAYHVQSHDGAAAEVYLLVPGAAGSGAVDSVNGETGVVVLDATDINIAALAPASYTPTSTSVEGHLSGINTALAGDAIAALSRDWGSLGDQTLDLAIAEAATSGGGTLDNGVQVNVGDEDVVYSRATHGDAPAFWYDVALSPGRTLTFPRTEGVEGGICLVRCRTPIGVNDLTVRLESNDSPGTFVDLPVPANHMRILRKSSDSPSWWTDFGFHQNGAQVNHAFASQAEMEAGTVAQARSMSPQRVAQAITALAGSGSEQAPSLVSISGSTAGNLALTARAHLNVVVMAANGAALTVPAGAPPGSSWLIYSDGASATVQGQTITQGHFATAIVTDDSPFTISVQRAPTAAELTSSHSPANFSNGAGGATALGQIQGIDTALGLRAPKANPTFTGLMTVAGVRAASGAVSNTTLTEAAHGGGVFTCSGSITCPNAAGFSVTLLATASASVKVGTGAATSLATDDILSVFIPAVGKVRAVHTLAADVISMPAA